MLLLTLAGYGAARAGCRAVLHTVPTADAEFPQHALLEERLREVQVCVGGLHGEVSVKTTSQPKSKH